MTEDRRHRIDPDGMFDAICQFPEQLADGRRRAREVDIDLSSEDFDHVVIVGMGGSAIGGDLLRTFVLDQAQIPVFVSRSYHLPAFVGPNSLVVASSYSGNTEETLSGLAQAQAREATILCLTSGGKVKRIASAHDYPCIEMPGGYQPRAALGYSLGALLQLAERLGLASLEEEWIEVDEVLPELAKRYAEESENKALELANDLYGRIPLIYSSEGFLEAVNLRWRGQMEENAKTLAFGNFLPEQNHNEIMGWEREHPIHEMLAIVVLRDANDHPRVKRRFDVMQELLEGRGAVWREVRSQGTRPLTRMLSLLHLGDWVSYYLALQNEVNPTPVKLISELKETLS